MLALIAGAGALPAAVAAAQGMRPRVACLAGFLPEGLSPDSDLVWRVETLGSLFPKLRDRGVTEVCFCGAVERPNVDPQAIDSATKPLISILKTALHDKGDDAVLRALIGIFEAEGFAVRAAHEAAPALLPPTGVLTRATPGEGAEALAKRGDAVSAEQGARDLGQACVVGHAGVIAREDARGTDAMLAGLDPAQSRGAMFFKAPKPGQDRRADLPVIGPETVRSVARAGLAGLTIAAGGVMVLNRETVVAACDRAGLYLWVRAQ